MNQMVTTHMSCLLREYTTWPDEKISEYIRLGIWSGESLFDLLERSAQRYPENLAVVDSSSQLTYAQLRERVLQLADGLKDLGVLEGDKVILQMPNCVEFFEIFFALIAVKAIPVMALPAHRQTELLHFIEISDAKYYFTVDYFDRFNYKMLAKSLKIHFSINAVVILGDADEFISFKELYGNAHDVIPSKGMDLALLQLSGGTTNLPKLIPRTHNDYEYSIRQSVDVCLWNDQTRFLAVLPVSHNFTLSSPGCLGVLSVGGCLVLGHSAAPDVAFKLIRQYQVNWAALVPSLATVWLNTSSDKKAMLSSLEVLQVGGARITDSLANRVVEELGCQLQQVFGMAEGLVNYTRLHDSQDLIQKTQGRPMSEFDELLVVDEDDNPVPSGEEGNLLVRGPYTINGYYRAAEHNKKAFTKDGYYRTGDVVRILHSGHLVVEGRAKDQINRGGEKISVPEVESYLLEIEQVQDVALISVDDEFLGERSCAVIKLKDNSYPFSVADVRRFLSNKNIANYKIPDYVKVMEELPKTAFGKVSKKRLREMLEETVKV